MILIIIMMYLRDSKTKGINTGNIKYSFTTAATWRLALTFLEVFHLHRSLTTLSINGIAYDTRFSGRLFVNIYFTKCTFMLHNCCIYFGRYCFVSNRFRRLFVNMPCHHTLHRFVEVCRIELDKASA